MTNLQWAILSHIEAVPQGQFMIQEYRSETLERILQRLHTAVDGVKASVIVNVDGLLVASYPPSEAEDSPTNSPQVGAMAATLLELANNTLQRLAQGSLDRILMEAEQGLMLVYPAGKAAVAVLLEKDARLERVFYATSRAAKEVVDILGLQAVD